VLSNDRKKIKLEEETISEILVADTDSESGAEASDVEDDFEQQAAAAAAAAAAEVEPQAATRGGLPTWGPPQGKNTNIHPFVSPTNGVKKSEAPHMNKYSLPKSVLMFFTEIFHLLVEQTNIYYQQQAGTSHQFTLPDMTFVDTLHDYWSRLSQLHNPFYGETMTRDRFLHILCLLHFADNSET